jgi:hypothetical protein
MSDRITLNVGGTRYETTRSTLCSYKGSMLERMFGGQFNTKPDEDGSYFIDRDGELFRHIMHVLRNGPIIAKNLPSSRESRINIELEYFGLPLVNVQDEGTRNAFPLVLLDEEKYESIKYDDNDFEGIKIDVLENGYSLIFGNSGNIRFSIFFNYRIKIINIETRYEMNTKRSYILKYRVDFESSSSTLGNTLSFSSNQQFNLQVYKQFKLINQVFAKYWN